MKRFFTFYGFLQILMDFGFMKGILYILLIFTDFDL